MIKVYPLFLLFFLISGCTNLSPKFQKRTPAQVENDTAIFSPSYIGSDVGTVRISMLDEGTFRKINGRGWVLADGRCVSTKCNANEDSDYFKLTMREKIPDMRGKFLRAKNNKITSKDCPEEDSSCFDSAGERALGSYQKDTFEEHNHSIPARFKLSDGSNLGTYTQTGSSATGNTGGKETRPKNIAVNFFIKINDD